MGFHQLHLAPRADQGDHDLGHHTGTPATHLDRGLKDRLRLHGVDFRQDHTQPHAAHAQHRVELGQSLGAAGHVRQGLVQGLGQFAQSFARMGQKLMQGRIEQADADRQAGHDLEQLHKVRPLHRQKPRQRGGAVMRGVGKDHLAHHDQTIFVKEHVFRAAQADALGFKLSGHGGICRRVGIGANADVAHLIRPTQERAKTVVQRGCQHLGGPGEHLARGAVQRDDIPFAEHPAIGGDQLFVLAVQPQSRRTHHTGQAQAARDHRRMAGDTATFGQHPDRRMHAANVLGRGFAPHQDAGLTARSTCLRCGRGKHQPPHGAPGTCGDALGKNIAGHPRVDLRVQKFRQRAGFDPQHRLVMRNHPILRQGHCNL